MKLFISQPMKDKTNEEIKATAFMFALSVFV